MKHVVASKLEGMLVLLEPKMIVAKTVQSRDPSHDSRNRRQDGLRFYIGNYPCQHMPDEAFKLKCYRLRYARRAFTYNIFGGEGIYLTNDDIAVYLKYGLRYFVNYLTGLSAHIKAPSSDTLSWVDSSLLGVYDELTHRT